MAKRGGKVARWIERQLQADPPRSKSLIMTVFGDSIAPYASGLWLSELVRLMEPFGVNERLVRTSGFRLAEEGWLQPERSGRRSRYSLTTSGWERVEHASGRIYAPPPAHWDGKWTLLVLRRSGNAAAGRLQLRRELQWEGFGTLGPGMFLHPCADGESVHEVVKRLGLQRSVVLLEASELKEVSPNAAEELVGDCWALGDVRARYQHFLASFASVNAIARAGLEPEPAFVVQTLVIHAFRRAVLHDPRLPAPLVARRLAGALGLRALPRGVQPDARSRPRIPGRERGRHRRRWRDALSGSEAFWRSGSLRDRVRMPAVERRRGPTALSVGALKMMISAKAGSRYVNELANSSCALVTHS